LAVAVVLYFVISHRHISLAELEVQVVVDQDSMAAVVVRLE
jgi:hypothetical protein